MLTAFQIKSAYKLLLSGVRDNCALGLAILNQEEVPIKAKVLAVKLVTDPKYANGFNTHNVIKAFHHYLISYDFTKRQFIPGHLPIHRSDVLFKDDGLDEPGIDDPY